MNKHYIFNIEEQDVGGRLDVFLAEHLENISRSGVQKLLEDGCVTINQKQVAKNYRLRKGDVIRTVVMPPKPLNVLPQNIPLDIVYEDNDLLVVNKPKGMVVHPAPGNPDGTLVNALLYHCGDSLSGINGIIRPGIVHRIDKDTSGLLIVAKNDIAHQALAEQIKEHTFTRFYEAVVYGNLKDDTGSINAPIGRHPIDRKKMAVTDKNSKSAVTYYTVLNRYQGFTHVRLQLKTGRTHQIRVHMAYLGHPVAGDTVYGPKKVIRSLQGQCLHARTIGFIHPTTKNYLEFTSELPNYFIDFLKTMQ